MRPESLIYFSYKKINNILSRQFARKYELSAKFGNKMHDTQSRTCPMNSPFHQFICAYTREQLGSITKPAIRNVQRCMVNITGGLTLIVTCANIQCENSAPFNHLTDSCYLYIPKTEKRVIRLFLTVFVDIL